MVLEVFVDKWLALLTNVFISEYCQFFDSLVGRVNSKLVISMFILDIMGRSRVGVKHDTTYIAISIIRSKPVCMDIVVGLLFVSTIFFFALLECAPQIPQHSGFF